MNANTIVTITVTVVAAQQFQNHHERALSVLHLSGFIFMPTFAGKEGTGDIAVLADLYLGDWLGGEERAKRVLGWMDS